jgi:hypothetical protein
MNGHVMMRLAHRFPLPTVQPIAGWRYRRDIGAWVDCHAPDTLYADGVALVNAAQPNPKPKPTPEPQPKPKPRPPMSKKCDMETGEDMKGE